MQDAPEPPTLVEGPAASSLAEEPAAPAFPRYCSGCGAAWEAGWTGCPICARRGDGSSAAKRTEEIEERPLRRSLSLYFALLATSLAGVIATISSGRPDGPAQLFIQWTVQAVDTLLVFAWCLAARKDIAPLVRATSGLRWYAFAAAGSLATFAVASLAVEGLVRTLGIEKMKLAEPVFEAGHGWPALLLMVSLQPAIVEELAFRGVILGALGRFLKPGEAVVVSSMMFMVLHLLPMSFPHLFLMGLALGFLRIRSGSIYPPILLHFLHNLYCVIAEVHGGP